MRHERSRLRTWIAALIALVIGIFLLWLSQQFPHKWFERVINDLGSITIATVALVLIFDYWQKEAFFGELFRTAAAAEQLKASGIVGFAESFQDLIDWEDLFTKSSRLDIVFAYGATWRNSHRQRVERMLTHDKARLRVVLPDMEYSPIVDELSQRFNLSPNVLRSRVKDALDDFGRLAERFEGKVEVYVLGRTMTYSSYRFNNSAVIAFYTHHPERAAVPTLVAERGGQLYDFVRREWYGIIDNGLTSGYCRRVIPEK